MSIFSKLFNKGNQEDQVGGMQDYMMLIRVYFQAAIAQQANITNIAMLPDLRMFKSTFKVPTEHNKLGIGEKSRCKKMLKDIYGHDDNFFKEIDKSIAKNCRKLQDVNTFMLQFQGFSQEMMMLTSNLMKFKLRIPSFFKKILRTATEQTVNEIFTKNDFSDAGVLKSVVNVRKYNAKLGFSEQWCSDFIFQVVMLAKKEKQPEQ